jgi:hypothetical protein
MRVSITGRGSLWVNVSIEWSGSLLLGVSIGTFGSLLYDVSIFWNGSLLISVSILFLGSLMVTVSIFWNGSLLTFVSILYSGSLKFPVSKSARCPDFPLLWNRPEGNGIRANHRIRAYGGGWGVFIQKSWQARRARLHSPQKRGHLPQ